MLCLCMLCDFRKDAERVSNVGKSGQHVVRDGDKGMSGDITGIDLNRAQLLQLIELYG